MAKMDKKATSILKGVSKTSPSGSRKPGDRCAALLYTRFSALVRGGGTLHVTVSPDVVVTQRGRGNQ